MKLFDCCLKFRNSECYKTNPDQVFNSTRPRRHDKNLDKTKSNIKFNILSRS